jgi:hypothetical protein
MTHKPACQHRDDRTNLHANTAMTAQTFMPTRDDGTNLNANTAMTAQTTMIYYYNINVYFLS